jgi:hypothetical protein
MSTTTKQLDTGELEERVKRMYEEVALEPERDFHFETGRPLAERESATSSTWPRSSRAIPCSISAAARAWTASSPRWRPDLPVA